MIEEFEQLTMRLIDLVGEWDGRLKGLDQEVIANRRNSQNRTIKQIVGHMIDSASNNLHRFVHLQYRESPLQFPNYATFGNNDRWIKIQNYQGEDWDLLVQLWKYLNLHVVHVLGNVDPSKLDNLWESGEDSLVSLRDMIIDYLRHFELHLREIDDLIQAD